MSNTYNQHYNLGLRGHTDGTAAAAEGYKKHQQEQDRKRKANQEWEDDMRRRGNAALNRSTAKATRSTPARKPEKTKDEDGYFSWLGAILGFVLAFGNAMNTPEADPIMSGIIGLIAAAILGKTFKYLLWIGGVVVLLFIFFGGENGGN